MAQQITSINLKLFAISLHEVMSITTYTEYIYCHTVYSGLGFK